MPNPANTSLVLSYLADVKTANHYSSFGAIAKTFGQTPLLAFNGQRKSTEIGVDAQTALYWEYNGDVARRANIDPIPKTTVSPYAVLGNSPIMFVDPSGADWYRNKDGNVVHNRKHGKAGDAGWLGNGKTLDFEGYHYERGKDAMQILENVIVTAKAKAKESAQPVWGGFHWNSNYNHADVLKSQNNYSNFQKGNFSGLSPAQVKLYGQWQQADKDWRAMSYGAVGLIAAPLVVMGAVESGAAFYVGNSLRSGLQYGIRTYGRDFVINTAKQYFANRGRIEKIDWFDVTLSTANPFRKFGIGGGIVTEYFKAAVDVRGSGITTAIDGSKSLTDFGMDFIMGGTKVSVRGGLSSVAGGDISRDFFIDIIADQYKQELKKVFNP